MATKTKKNPPVNVSVSDTENVILTITIGNADIGGSEVKFGDSPDVLIRGKVTDFLVGKGAALRGRTLEITTNVLDVNPGTNKIVVTHDFDNANPSKSRYDDSVDADGDIYTLITSYVFI